MLAFMARVSITFTVFVIKTEYAILHAVRMLFVSNGISWGELDIGYTCAMVSALCPIVTWHPLSD